MTKADEEERRIAGAHAACVRAFRRPGIEWLLKEQRRMANDNELLEMQRIWRKLESYTPAARRRIVDYLAARTQEAEAEDRPGNDAHGC